MRAIASESEALRVGLLTKDLRLAPGVFFCVVVGTGQLYRPTAETQPPAPTKDGYSTGRGRRVDRLSAVDDSG